ncbi:MAG: ABC transporter ATP-binding protein [Candidatus Eremiobacteraeota bacterium]|nr:ABC transporter ATP-binding protein [Candidatus Eremiobacteraeota bacterium]
MAPVAAVRNVQRSYRAGGIDVLAVRQASFDLERGQFVALTGASGSGKSTLLNLLACVDVPTAGTISIMGHDTRSLSDDALTILRRESIGYVFQFFNLMPTMSVRENVELPLLLAGWPRGRRAAAVGEVLDQVGMGPYAKRRPSELSGGQQQRVAVARAVVHDPPLVLADEPTGNLDSHTGAEILALLRSACKTRDTAMLVATHSAEAALAADRVLRMHDGELIP